jgi:hypothetical protein
MTQFDFYPSIPATNNNPSNDQPLMQTNNQSINDLIAVDHVTFGVINGGTHKQVTFSSNNTPSLPTTFPTFFTDATTGLAQPRFYSGSAAQSSTQYVPNLSPGSTFALGGVIIKWGTISFSAQSTVSISYAGSFINATLSVVISAKNANGTTRNIWPNSISSSGFTATSASGSITGDYYYIAVGY